MSAVSIARGLRYAAETHLHGLRPVPASGSSIAPEGRASSPSDLSRPACVVGETSHGAALFAARDIAAGTTVLLIAGRLLQHPTRFSIQLGDGVHIEADGTLPEAEMRARHPWRFLNHSCDPNARVDARSLVALRPIACGEQVTFDYTTTEASMAEPFTCLCGASGCVGSVRGFLHLDEAQQAARRALLAPHLRALLQVR